jgi:Tfp pilus assembly protein PilF
MIRRTALTLLLCLAIGCATPPAPTHPRALENNEFCAQYMAVNNLDKAEIHCDLGLQFSPNYADLWVNKGIIALRRGQKEVAKDHFIKALRLNNEQAQAYNNLGVIYQQDQAYGKAHDMFQRALKVNPDYVEARYNLALTFQKMGDKANARKEYRTLLAVSPNIADAHENLGIMALEDHAIEEAVTELSKAVELDPKFADAWLNLGAAYMEAGKFAEAKDAYTSCLEADPDNVPCRNNVAIANRKAVVLDPTLKEVQNAQGLENSAPAMFAQAQQFRDKGLRSEEERFYKRCVRIDGKYAPCHYGLFTLYQEEQKGREATIACKNFLKFAVADEFPKEVESCEKFLSASSY